MLVLFQGVAAVVGAVVPDGCHADSWLRFRRGRGDALKGERGTLHTCERKTTTYTDRGRYL